MNLKQHAIPMAVLLAATSVFSLSLLFCPHSAGTFGHDAGVFAYMGYEVTQGKALYTEAWDNKGPLLYLINALGVALNYRYGIFALEVVSLFTAMLFMYRTALLFTTRYVAVISVMLSFMPLTVTLEGGNLSEEWALPFTSIAFFYVSRLCCNNHSSKKYAAIIIGACTAAVSLLRLNLVVFIGVAILGTIIIFVKNKQGKELASFAVFFILGFLIAAGPIAIYLAATDSLVACLESAYFGAVESFSDITLKQRLINVSEMVIQLMKSGAFFINILFVSIFPAYLYKTKGISDPIKTLLTISFVGLFATLGANSISGAAYMHYFMAFIPVMLLPITWFANAVYAFFKKTNVSPFAATAVVAALALFVSMNSIGDLRNNIIANLTSNADADKMKIAAYIEENSLPNDTVQVFGDPTINYITKRNSASSYFYYANGRFSDKAKTRFANSIMIDIMKEKPKLIIFDKQKMHDFMQHLNNQDEMSLFLKENYIADEVTMPSYTLYVLK